MRKEAPFVIRDFAIAANRFGMGVRPDRTPPRNAADWLLGQMDHFDPSPPAIAALPGRSVLIEPLQQLRALQAQKKVAADDSVAMAQQVLGNYRKSLRDHYAAAVAARLQVAVASEQDFAERLVYFWSNHFAISTDKAVITPLAGNFEFAAIRPHIFGSFGDLLKAAVKHPAMLLYLDQAQSIGPDSPLAQRVRKRRDTEIGLNENLAREILELHTLGVRSGYGQDDVTEFARALTGHSVTGLARGPLKKLVDGDTAAGEAIFVDAIHQPGVRQVMVRRYAGQGEAQADAILSDLAVHPATARHIATKLATHFAADDPPPALVSRLEKAFLETGGDLKALYRILITAPEITGGAAAKFKTPWEWTVSALRAITVPALPGNAQAAAGLLNQMGQAVWRPGSPAGFGDVAKDWAGPAALMRRVETAGRLARLASGAVDARQLGLQILPGGLSLATAEQIARAESPAQGLALLLVAPEFLRR